MSIHRTAIQRTSPSKPAQKLAQILSEIDAGRISVLDYGCGHGCDVAFWKWLGCPCKGYDPYSEEYCSTSVLGKKYDLVTCFYVLNVLPPSERLDALIRAWKCTRSGGILAISVRVDSVRGNPYHDGVVTSAGTFQTQKTKSGWERWFKKNAGVVPASRSVSGGVLFLLEK